MKEKLIVPILLLALLSGCAWPGGEYLSVTTHQAQHTTAHSGSLSAANYHQLRQVLTDLVSAGTENAVIHVPEYQQDLVESGMEAAAHYLRVLLPLGAYAVEDVTYEIGTVGGQPAISVSVTYLHGRSELRKIKEAADMDEAQVLICDALEQCADGIVLLVEDYTNVDLVQMVADYADNRPDLVMEVPQAAVGVYPDTGRSRVLELKFTYQTSRDSLRQMKTQVQRVFASASLYVSSDGNDHSKFSQLFTFLTERFDYKLETSITPAYSLLCHGVGDSKAFATAYAAMCRAAGLDCQVVSGTCAGEARFWNMVRSGDIYYHVDLLSSKTAGDLQMLTDDAMEGYVWDYSAYPTAGGSVADE